MAEDATHRRPELGRWERTINPPQANEKNLRRGARWKFMVECMKK